MTATEAAPITSDLLDETKQPVLPPIKEDTAGLA